MTDTFNFPYHQFAVEYPESSFRMKLGRGYTFSAAPDSPDRRIFKLTFPAMRYYVDGSGNIDSSTNATNNVAVLETFYQAHKQHVTFIYPHPVYGNVNVRFNKPLSVPKGSPGGGGTVENIEVEFEEQP